MKLKPCDIKEVGKIQYFKKTRNLLLLEEFVNGDMDCAKDLWSWLNNEVDIVSKTTKEVINENRESQYDH